MLLPPISAMVLVTELVTELPRVMMAITAAMPMIIPSMVRIARILLANRPDTAKYMFSHKSIAMPSPFSH